MFEKLINAFEEAVKKNKKGIVMYANEIAYNELSLEISRGNDWYKKICNKLAKGEEVVITSGSNVLGIVILPVEELKKTEYFIAECRKWSEFISGPVDYM